MKNYENNLNPSTRTCNYLDNVNVMDGTTITCASCNKEIDTGSQSIETYLIKNGRYCQACNIRAGKNCKATTTKLDKEYTYAYQLEKHHIKATKEL